MQRREFIKHSSLVLAVAVVGAPALGSAFDNSRYEELRSFKVHAVGVKRFGCARTLDDPVVALSQSSDNSISFT